MQASKEEQQKAFEDCVLFLLKQGKKSTNEFGCGYRGDNETKCAIGFLIPDNEYSESFEGLNIIDIREGVWIIPSIEKYSTEFLASLQNIHDSIYDDEKSNFTSLLVENAQRFATKWKLQMPEVPSENPNG